MNITTNSFTHIVQDLKDYVSIDFMVGAESITLADTNYISDLEAFLSQYEPSSVSYNDGTITINL